MMSATVERVNVIVAPDGSVHFQDVSEGALGLAGELGWTPPAVLARDSQRPRYLKVKDRKVPIISQELKNASVKELWSVYEGAQDETDKDLPRKMASLMELKVALAYREMSGCKLCAWRCSANRLADEVGLCGSGRPSRVTRAFMSYGEEVSITPCYSIFLSGCNWHCSYCQYPHELDTGNGHRLDPGRMAQAIEEHAAQGAQAVQFLGGNPDQHLPSILAALDNCEAQVKVAWNSNGYASREAMRLLDGVVDVYLTDFRYGNDRCAQRYGAGPRAWEVVTRNLFLAADQGATLIIRHLQLPGHWACCTKPCLHWIAENLRRPNVRINLMGGQYIPAYMANHYPQINRTLTPREKERTRSLAEELGLLLVGSSENSSVHLSEKES